MSGISGFMSKLSMTSLDKELYDVELNEDLFGYSVNADLSIVVKIPFLDL